MENKWMSRWFCSHVNLKNNRWEPGQDELAVYFDTSALSGVLTKTLRVPSGCRARLLIDNRVLDLNEGEEQIENLWQRINGIFGGKYGEVLITRNAALLVPFSFANLLCGDLKRVNADLGLRVELGDIQLFRNHFMRRAGAVNVAHLQSLLSDAVRQRVDEFVHAYLFEELQSDPTSIRQKLYQLLDSDIHCVLNEHGLRLNALESLSWSHEMTNDELLEAELSRKSEEARQCYYQGGLKADEAEMAAALRDRNLDLLERVKKADTREDAIRLGAAEAIERLEEDYLRGQRTRQQTLLGESYAMEDEHAEWAHLKELAEIRRQSIQESMRATRAAEAQLTQRRFANQLEKMLIESEIEQARLIEDEVLRQVQVAISMEKLAKVWLNEESLNRAQHQIQVDSLLFEDGLKKRNKLREQEWEDAQMEAQIIRLRTETSETVASVEHRGLRGLIELDDLYDRNAIARDRQMRLNSIEADLLHKRGQMEIDLQRADLELRNELRRAEVDRLACMQRSDLEIRNATLLGSLPPEALAALVSNPEQLNAIKAIVMARISANKEPKSFR